MNSRSVFSYSQYHRTIVLYLSYRNDIFMGAAFHHKNSKKNKYNRLHIKYFLVIYQIKFASLMLQ